MIILRFIYAFGWIAAFLLAVAIMVVLIMISKIFITHVR